MDYAQQVLAKVSPAQYFAKTRSIVLVGTRKAQQVSMTIKVEGNFQAEICDDETKQSIMYCSSPLPYPFSKVLEVDVIMIKDCIRKLLVSHNIDITI